MWFIAASWCVVNVIWPDRLRAAYLCAKVQKRAPKCQTKRASRAAGASAVITVLHLPAERPTGVGLRGGGGDLPGNLATWLFTVAGVISQGSLASVSFTRAGSGRGGQRTED